MTEELTYRVVIKEGDGRTENFLKHLIVKVLRGINSNFEKQQCSDEAEEENSEDDGREDSNVKVGVNLWHQCQAAHTGNTDIGSIAGCQVVVRQAIRVVPKCCKPVFFLV